MRALIMLLVPGALALDPGPFQPLTMPRPEAPGEPWEITERADGLLVRGRGLRVLLDAQGRTTLAPELINNDYDLDQRRFTPVKPDGDYQGPSEQRVRTASGDVIVSAGGGVLTRWRADGSVQTTRLPGAGHTARLLAASEDGRIAATFFSPTYTAMEPDEAPERLYVVDLATWAELPRERATPAREEDTWARFGRMAWWKGALYVPERGLGTLSRGRWRAIPGLEDVGDVYLVQGALWGAGTEGLRRLDAAGWTMVAPAIDGARSAEGQPPRAQGPGRPVWGTGQIEEDGRICGDAAAPPTLALVGGCEGWTTLAIDGSLRQGEGDAARVLSAAASEATALVVSGGQVAVGGKEAVIAWESAARRVLTSPVAVTALAGRVVEGRWELWWGGRGQRCHAAPGGQPECRPSAGQISEIAVTDAGVWWLLGDGRLFRDEAVPSSGGEGARPAREGLVSMAWDADRGVLWGVSAEPALVAIDPASGEERRREPLPGLPASVPVWNYAPSYIQGPSLGLDGHGGLRALNAYGSWTLGAAALDAFLAASAPPEPIPPPPGGCEVPAEEGAPLAPALYPEAPEARRAAVVEAWRRCNTGDYAGCDALGQARAAGEVVPASGRGAAGLYRRGCDAGRPESCALLGSATANGSLGCKDLERATTLLSGACEAGAGVGCASLGILTVQSDKARARELFEEGCALNASSCQNLAYMLDTGDGVPEDDARAAELYARACDAGTAWSCYNLSLLLSQGQVQGVSADQAPTLAFGRLERACDLGMQEGCAALGERLRDGRGVAQDATRARELLTRSCSSGEGCAALGDLLAEGLGGGRDLKGAASLYDRACRSYDPRGCRALAEMLQRGEGVKKDRALALDYLEHACEGLGDEESCAAWRQAGGVPDTP